MQTKWDQTNTQRMSMTTLSSAMCLCSLIFFCSGCTIIQSNFFLPHAIHNACTQCNNIVYFFDATAIVDDFIGSILEIWIEKDIFLWLYTTIYEVLLHLSPFWCQFASFFSISLLLILHKYAENCPDKISDVLFSHCHKSQRRIRRRRRIHNSMATSSADLFYENVCRKKQCFSDICEVRKKKK